MKRAFLVGLVLSQSSCDDANDKALDEASALADRLCACPDTACADKVTGELEEMKARRKGGDLDAPSGKQTARAVKISIRWDECLERVSRRSK